MCFPEEEGTRGVSGLCYPGPLLHLHLPGVGQGGSHTDPHSHEDGGQTCVHRGDNEDCRCYSRCLS